MQNGINLFWPILIPLAVGFVLVPFLRRKPAVAAILSLLGMAGAALAFAPLLYKSGLTFFAEWVPPFNLSFSLTPWKGILLLFAFLFQLMGGIYMLRYVSSVPRPTQFLMFSLLAFSATGTVVLTDNVLILLVAWEVFLGALYAVILSGGEHTEAVARKALIIGGTSDFLMILGLMLYLGFTGGEATFAGHVAVGADWVAFASFVLIFLGAGAKAGMFPFHTWIPDAAEVMPAPGFALLPGSLEKLLGIYFLYILTTQMFVLNEAAQLVMYAFAAATVFVAIVPALIERNMKKVLALTAICPVGFMVAGMATNEIAGVAGALMYMLTHAVYKSAMFFCAGNLEAETGSASLERIEGRRRLMPLTAFGFLMAFAAAVSLPPTGGFLAKELILESLLHEHQYVMFILLWLGAILMMAVFLKMAGVLLAGRREKEASDAPFVQVLPILALGAVALFSGSLFTSLASMFGGLMEAESLEWILSVWHFSPVTVASFGIYLFGTLLFFAARKPGEPVWKTFDGLRTSPALGKAFERAEARCFDAYEIGLNVLHWVANVVFRYFERLVDPVFEGILRIGRGITRPALSAVHNGIYGRYLSWVLVGFLLVLALLFIK